MVLVKVFINENQIFSLTLLKNKTQSCSFCKLKIYYLGKRNLFKLVEKTVFSLQ